MAACGCSHVTDASVLPASEFRARTSTYHATATAQQLHVGDVTKSSIAMISSELHWQAAHEQRGTSPSRWTSMTRSVGRHKTLACSVSIR